MPKRVLVTGASGFVGRHMVPLLEHVYDYSVVGIDVKPAAPTDDLNHVRYSHIQMDCRQFFAENTTQFDLVIHLAAIVGGRAKIERDPLTVATDLAIDADMFNWAMRTRQKRIVYFSSSAAYPISLQDPSNFNSSECHPLSESFIKINQSSMFGVPDLTYGWTKLTGEFLAQYALKDGIPTHILRPFSGYGPDQDLDYPFPSFIRRALKREDPFVIWGDGTQQRDWTHIADITYLTMQAVEKDIFVPVNLCTGRRTSFIELAKMVCDAVGYEPELEFQLNAPQGVMQRVGSPARMHQLLGRPIHTLEEGIDEAIRVSYND